MAKTSRRMPIGIDAVWAVLEDGGSYADWVVGTQTIHAVDDGFPAVGRRLHYRVGAGPLGWDGDTLVREVDPGVRLQVQRFEGGGWTDFPVSARVSGGQFNTYITTSRSGATRFRVFDQAAGKPSNPVRVQIG